eukprot:TRINITY_DN41537_c0_g1_i1.p1 TRINITY_DN41537_c0_g1~~TRINITY_DN41537_c0_g1_i1.p1  ORF type:complete len:120 (-),score=3.85 TRINITY_DN41537_c0_g1_i1:332-691(-)
MCKTKMEMRPVFSTPAVFVHNPYACTLPAQVAGPPPDPPICKPVCLDFLRGECGLRRESCSYAHPELHVLTKRSNLVIDGKKVCPIWSLTGFCKFGPRCNDYHPRMEGPLAVHLLSQTG